MSITTAVYCGVSLDGFIARPDGSVDFLEGFEPAVDAAGNPDDLGFHQFLASVDVMVMGRNTFDWVMDSGHPWPYGDLSVVVLTQRPLEIPADLAATVDTACLAPGELLDVLASRLVERVYLDGGNTIQQFLATDLVDELIVTTVPRLIGQGIPLFGPLANDLTLRVDKSVLASNGFVQTHYRRVR